ncbi:dihydroneopterin aldolase [uncultured Brevundimonas sp.]|uniref:dihydroneopterin aldolase n=1 Tax=uncultured Brevundimonas sp. TaxID=213418 RepID=UPI0030EC1633|tara:strand:- start:2020 stop:2418 length:399 start_codon:yes stop_codon:yes gene_type:complete
MASSPTVTPFPLGGTLQREGLSVFVRGLKLDVGIGVYDHEHGRLQTLVIDVTLEMGPVVVEHLADTINYETVAAAARAVAAAGHVGLVETFAERLAMACLDDPRVRRVAVRIEKPGALDGAEAAGCEVAFSR